MKAIVIYGPGDIRCVETGKPVAGPGDVLTKVQYCGICGTDLSILSGDMTLIRDGRIKYPVRIGHEWSGIVEEVGDEVVGIKPGDKVIGDNFVSCGECPNCKKGDFFHCGNCRAVGTVNCWDGAFAEYMLMPARHVHVLPDNIDLDEAALVEPSTIAYNGLLQGDIDAGSSVLITGTGPIGLAAVTLSKILGAYKVIVAGRKDGKLSVGTRIGADAVINVMKENLEDAVMRETDGKGADLVLETSGSIDCIIRSLSVVRSKGVVSLVGFYEKDLNGVNIDDIVMRGIYIKGLRGHEGVINRVIEMLASSRLDLKPLITHRFSFDQAVDAFKTAHEKNETKIKMLVEINEK